MADHWWWRPGWAPGRRYLTWHLTFGDSGAACMAAERYRSVLRAFPGLDEVPDRWLHLTMQGVGFVDDLAPGTGDRVASAARAHLSGVGHVMARLAPAEVGTEGVYFPVDDQEELQRIRLAVRAAVIDAIGQAPGEAAEFWPHLSVAYSNAEGPSEAIHKAVAAVPFLPVSTPIDHVDLIALGRDRHVYEWTTIARLHMG